MGGPGPQRSPGTQGPKASQARRGALQGTLFMRKGQRDSLKNEVRTLVDLATDDKDQWVSLIARALGGLRERFDLQQLQQDVPAVSY